jgi:hypothetical protein
LPDMGYVIDSAKAIVGVAPVIFGPRIRISCTGHRKHPRVRLSLRKAA